jgi:hypothetical protein
MARTLQEPCQKLGVPFELRADPSLPLVDLDQARFKEILSELSDSINQLKSNKTNTLTYRQK